MTRYSQYLWPAAALVIGGACLLWFADGSTFPAADAPDEAARLAGNQPLFWPQISKSKHPISRAEADSRSRLDALLAAALAADNKVVPSQELKALHLFAAGDPEALDELVRRYQTPVTRGIKDTIMLVLTRSAMTPTGFDLAQRLTQSNDPAERRDGYTLLQKMLATTPETRSLIGQTLAAEQDPTVLTQAIQALGSEPATVAERAGIVSQLRGLTAHADPDVRAQSVRHLALWDKGNAEAALTQALSDQMPTVRSIAATSVRESGLRSEGLKSTLMAMLTDPMEDNSVRYSAAVAMEELSMTTDEQATYVQSRGEIEEQIRKIF